MPTQLFPGLWVFTFAQLELQLLSARPVYASDPHNIATPSPNFLHQNPHVATRLGVNLSSWGRGRGGLCYSRLLIISF